MGDETLKLVWKKTAEEKNEAEKKQCPSKESEFSLIPPKRTCAALSFSLLLVIASFESLQNLQSSLNKENNIGVLSLAIIYGTVMFSSLLGPVLIRVFGVKNTLILCWATVTLYTVGNFHSTYAIMVFTSILIGIGKGNVGMIYGLYLTAASKSYLHYKHLSEDRFHGVLSLFYGIFFASFMSTHIVGNGLASVLFFISGYNNTYLETNTCGAWSCEHAAQNETVIERPEATVVYTLLGVFTLGGVAGILVTVLFLPRLDEYAGHKGSILERTFSSLKVVKSWKFCCIVPLYMAQALSIMTIYTGYTENFVSCSIGIKWVGYIMMCFGAVGVCVSSVANALVRYVGRATLVLLFILIDVSNAVFMLLWTPHHESPIALFFLVPALAGITEPLAQPQLNSFMAVVFKNSEAAAFASVTFIRSGVFAISLSVSGWLCLYYRLVTVLVLYTLGMLGYLVLEVYTHKEKETIASKAVLIFRKKLGFK